MVAAVAALLESPRRFRAVALLAGCLPDGAGPPLTDGLLAGVGVFYGFDPADPIIPGPYLERASAWLAGPSGAAYQERRYEGVGHELTPAMVEDVAGFLAETLGG